MNSYPEISRSHREPHTNKRRLLGAAVLVLVLVIFELSVGINLQKQHVSKLAENTTRWALTLYNAPSGTLSVPPKAKNTKRFLYVSNSHARTGGFVATHLQKLLDKVAPNQFEILDVADAGIFAPDMLQRVLASFDYDLDGIIVAVAYISFSDRMKLSLQAHSVRSFFKSEIFSKLSLGFWLRNYDIGLYANTLVPRFSKLYRYRSQVRNTWEKPLSNLLKSLTSPKYISFLEVDENQRWKFPDGYDNNLFQWQLYAAGRNSHLDDLKDIIAASRDAGLPILGFNLPVHWEKSLYQANLDDIEEYRTSLQNIFSGVLEYVDYQDIFPKEFTTYDALHPTWHGARLHALDIAFRLKKQGFFPEEISNEVLLTAFTESEPAISEEYRSLLDNHYPPLKRWGFRRYDISEPQNALHLLRRLATVPPGHSLEQELIYELSLRLRYWLEMPFSYQEKPDSLFVKEWYQAVHEEMAKAKIRASYFQDKLKQFQSQRLSAFEIPSFSDANLIMENTHIQIGPSLFVNKSLYRLSNETFVEQLTTIEGKPISFLVDIPENKSPFVRVDILGDGSFLLLQSDYRQLPHWFTNGTPLVKWGI
ncbi:MAG: hypothetical protein DRQ49_11750 [Gammaproteobacteria bacterium]|nr:MAG: hypothetical protein DRQ49_11750 [Gammaproteobacteria bacterium]